MVDAGENDEDDDGDNDNYDGGGNNKQLFISWLQKSVFHHP